MACVDSINAGHGGGKGYKFLFVPATTSSANTPPDEGQDYSTSGEGDQRNMYNYKLWSDLSEAEIQQALTFLVANHEKPYPKKMEKQVQEAKAASAVTTALVPVANSSGAEYKNHAATAPATADNEQMEEQEPDELGHGRGHSRNATQHHDGAGSRSFADELKDMDMNSNRMEIDDVDDRDAAPTKNQHQDQHHPHGTPLLQPGQIWKPGSVVPSVQPLSQPKAQSTLTPTLTPAPTITSLIPLSLSPAPSAWSSSQWATLSWRTPSLKRRRTNTTMTNTTTLSSSSSPLPAAVSQAKRDRLKKGISSSSSPFVHAGGGGVSTPLPPQKQSPRQSYSPQQPEEPHDGQQVWDLGLVKALKEYDGQGDDEDEDEDQQGGRRAQHRQHGTRRDGSASRKKKSIWPDM